MGLTNNMPPFSLSAHHFVQKGERLLLLLDHTLMDVLIIHSIPLHLFYSSLLLFLISVLFHLKSFHSFISLSRHSYQVSNGVFTFSSFHSWSFSFSIFLVFQPLFKDNAPYIHCTTFSFQIWIHFPQIHLFQHDSFYVLQNTFFILLLNIAIPHLSF